MQLRHLQYFLAVSEEGSIIQAARRLAVAQPALSKQIRDLEREIGVPLFERQARGTRLTAAGRAFLPAARSTMDSADRAVASARAAAHQRKNVLRFAHSSFAFYPPELTHLLAGFGQKHPDIEVEIQRLDQPELCKLLLEDRIDVGTAFLGNLKVPGLEVRQLLDWPLDSVVLSASHPLAGQAVVSLADLVDLTWVHAPRHKIPEVYRTVRAALIERSVLPKQHSGRISDATSAVMMVSAGNAWFLSNYNATRPFIQPYRAIVVRRFAEPSIPFWLTVLWRANSNNPLARTLVELAANLRNE